jgi:excisionase family DNA binding protein
LAGVSGAGDRLAAGRAICLPPNYTFLTLEQVAQSLGVSIKKVRCWIAAGELAATNMSASPTAPRRTYRVSLDALATFVAARSGQRVAQVRRGGRYRRYVT